MADGISFTPEQQAVIAARNCNLLVSAAAGSGKTAVLVERILRLITEPSPGPNGEKLAPADIDQLLVLTFTRAAAAQMKEKIGKAIRAKLLEEPGNTHLQKQETLLAHALITTIDSFCQSVIRNHFSEIGVDPASRIAEEGEIRLLQEDMIEDLLERKYAEAEGHPDSDFVYAMDYFGRGSSDQAAVETMKRIYTFSMSMPWPEVWLQEHSLDYAIPEGAGLDDLPWMREYLEEIRRDLQEQCRQYAEALKLTNEPGGPYMYGDLIEAELESLQKVADSTSYADFQDNLAELSFGRLPSKKDPSVIPELREQARNIRDDIKKRAEYYRKSVFAQSEEEILKHARLADRAVRAIFGLTLEFKQAMDACKRDKAIFDFGDLEHFALQILVKQDPETGGTQPTAAAESYREFFREVLVDEYQDSNYVQEEILQAVAAEPIGRRDRFMVGDVKQSIYRFRLARPEIFSEKLVSYGRAEAYGVQTEDPAAVSMLRGENLRIDLHLNFRSRKEVLDCTNAVFERVMAEDLGGVAYDEDAMLRVGNTGYPDPAGEGGPGADAFQAELWVLHTGGSDAGGDENGEDAGETGAGGSGSEDGDGRGREALTGFGADLLDDEEEELLTGSAEGWTSVQQEALLVANRIHELLRDGRVSDKDGFREVHYSDIVILLRSTSGWDESFRKVLESEGIPAYVQSKTGYFRAREVMTLMDMLMVIDNPRQDVALVSVMHSSIGGFTDEELAKIRIAGTEDPARRERFYEVVRRAAGASQDAGSQGHGRQPLQDGLRDKVLDFLALIRDFREKSRWMPVHELLQYMFDRTGFLETVTAMPGGTRRRANIDMLMQRAMQFEQTSYRGLYHFIRYMEHLNKVHVDYGESNVLDENADVVRIMSIHMSKGLEFPIVFVSGMGKKYNMSDTRADVLLDLDAGVGVQAIDLEKRIKYQDLRRNYLSGRMKKESLGEELRVFYVGMTRAREKLIMTGTSSKADKLVERYQQRITQDTTEPAPYAERLAAMSNLEQLICAGSQHLDRTLHVEMVTVQDLKARAEQEKSSSVDRLRTLEQLSHVPEEGHTEAQEDLASRISLEFREEVLRRFSYTYAHPEYANLFTKTTVTELKRRQMAEEEEPSAELFPVVPEQMEDAVIGAASGEETGSTAAETVAPCGTDGSAGGAALGTLYHKVFELLPLELYRTQDYRKIRDFLNSLPQEGMQRIRAEVICRFTASDLGKRMAAALERGQLHRESQFMMGLPAAEVITDAPVPEGSEELVLVQGIMDAWFEEEDGLVLVDYKTDRVETAEELRERYAVQLQYYRQALERMTGKTVRECLIYSVRLGETVAVS